MIWVCFMSCVEFIMIVVTMLCKRDYYGANRIQASKKI